MYYIYGVSVPSLLIESTDSMIHAEHQLLWEQTTDDRVELEEDARKGVDKPVRVSEKLINA